MDYKTLKEDDRKSYLPLILFLTAFLTFIILALNTMSNSEIKLPQYQEIEECKYLDKNLTNMINKAIKSEGKIIFKEYSNIHNLCIEKKEEILEKENKETAIIELKKLKDRLKKDITL